MTTVKKERHMRMTRQRRVILEEMRKLMIHPSADDVYAVVRRRLPRISLGTVYRNLEVLSELGEIQKLEVGGPLMRYDKTVRPHYHIRCIRCQRVDDVPMEFMGDIESALDGSMGYRFLAHHLEFTGICPICRGAEAAEGMGSGAATREKTLSTAARDTASVMESPTCH